MHRESITDPASLLPTCSLKMLCRNPLGNSSPCMALEKTFLCFKLQRFSLFGLTVLQAHKLTTWVNNNTGLTTLQISLENSQPWLALSEPYLSGAPAQLKEDSCISLYWGFASLSLQKHSEPAPGCRPAHCRTGLLVPCSTHCVLVTVAVSSF